MFTIEDQVLGPNAFSREQNIPLAKMLTIGGRVRLDNLMDVPGPDAHKYCRLMCSNLMALTGGAKMVPKFPSCKFIAKKF